MPCNSRCSSSFNSAFNLIPYKSSQVKSIQYFLLHQITVLILGVFLAGGGGGGERAGWGQDVIKGKLSRPPIQQSIWMHA